MRDKLIYNAILSLQGAQALLVAAQSQLESDDETDRAAGLSLLRFASEVLQNEIERLGLALEKGNERAS